MDSAERWTSVARIGAGRRPWVPSWWRTWMRPVPFALLMAAGIAARHGEGVDLVAASPESAIAEALAARGLACEPEDVAWIVGPRGVVGTVAGGGRALVRAHAVVPEAERVAGAPPEPSDLYLVEARLSPEGVVVELGDVYDVTETSGVDESRPVVRGRVAAYTTAADGLYTGVHVLDLAGRAPSTYRDFTRVQRAQLALTGLQQTGQTSGVVHDTYALDPVARRATLAWRDDGTLEVHADDHAVVLDPAATRVVSGEAWVR